jgi:hypothetical protein
VLLGDVQHHEQLGDQRAAGGAVRIVGTVREVDVVADRERTRAVGYDVAKRPRP